MDNIEQRLLVIEKDVGTLVKMFDGFDERQEDFVEDVRLVLFGNGKQKGLVARVDTNTEWIEHRKWFERVVVSAILGQVITMLFAILYIAEKLPK